MVSTYICWVFCIGKPRSCQSFTVIIGQLTSQRLERMVAVSSSLSLCLFLWLVLASLSIEGNAIVCSFDEIDI